MTPCWGCVDLGAMLDPSWAVLGPCWGYVELCWDHVGSCSVKIGAILDWTGLCWPILKFCWGYVGPSAVYVGPSRAMLGLWQTAQPDFVSKTLLLPGTGIPKMPPEQDYLGLSWGYVGAMFAHLGAMLGLCWMSGGDFGLSCFHDFTFTSKFCLKKLSPVACESHVWILCRRFACFWAPPRGLRVSRFERFCSHQWPASRRYLP